MSLPTTYEEKRPSIFRGTLDLQFVIKDCGFMLPISSTELSRNGPGINCGTAWEDPQKICKITTRNDLLWQLVWQS